MATNILKLCREATQLSLREVAQKTAITDSRLSKAENNTLELNFKELKTLAKLYKRNYLDLLLALNYIDKTDITKSDFFNNLINNKNDKQKNLTFIDLFAGVGGIHIGFSKIAKCVYASEIDPSPCETYKLNFPDTPMYGDITKQEIKDKIPQNFDILCAGFPCQAFSIAGHQLGFKDKRGNLFFDIVEIVKARKPRCIFLENVKNLVAHDEGNTFKVITKHLTDLGYAIHYKVLNSCEYGNVAQNRERIYIVCFNKETVKNHDDFTFPLPIDLTKNKISDYLEEKVGPTFFYSDKSVIYPKIKEHICDEDTFYQWRRKYVRANKSGVCPTLTANMGTGGHNVPIIKVKDGIRKLTPRECFNLQGFPASFKLPNLVNSKLYKQAGNSVSVPVICRIAKEISKILDV